MVKYLIKHDRQGVGEEDADGWTSLAWALFNNTPKTMQALLDSGLVDVNKKDINGRSAPLLLLVLVILMWSRSYRRHKALKLKARAMMDRDTFIPLETIFRCCKDIGGV